MGSPSSGDDPTRPGGPAPWQGGRPPSAQGGPYPYPGGPYPPQGPGGGYGGYGGPPPPDARSPRGLLIAVVVGLVVLAGLAVALVIAYTRDGGKTVAADPSETTSPAPTTSEAPSSSASPSSEPAADRTEELLATVPADFSDREPSQLVGDGDVAATVCGPSTTHPRPQDGTCYLYDDTGTLDSVFAEDTSGLDPLPEGEDCSTAPGSTQEELAALAEWWTTHSDDQS